MLVLLSHLSKRLSEDEKDDNYNTEGQSQIILDFNSILGLIFAQVLTYQPFTYDA